MKPLHFITPVDIPATAEAFLVELPGPAIFRLAGRDRTRTRFLSVLMHGNEPSGFRALHAWMRTEEQPATDVVCLVGAVDAARLVPLFSHRMVPGRRDLNRCFSPPFDGVDGALAEAVLQQLQAIQPEAVIDLHNNTGRNPIYGVGPCNDESTWKLTSLFSNRFVYSPIVLATLSEACQGYFVATTIECGQAGDPVADAAGLAGLQNYFRRDRLDSLILSTRFNHFHTPTRLHIDRQLRLAFAGRPVEEAELTLQADLDRENFRTVPIGRSIGWLQEGAPWPLRIPGPLGDDISKNYFERRGRELVTIAPWIPIMLTTSALAAQGDCLCYLAESS